jgi:aspartyl-tRNA(Asn)/glutamyl-tRNA(Gln) amidotransferase subunit C
MKITEKDVTYVADLGNVELTEEERTHMVRDLDAILGYVDMLSELDTKSVPPMAQVMLEPIADKNNVAVRSGLRPDVHRDSLPRTAAMKNAPATDNVFFKVPKVIEK